MCEKTLNETKIIYMGTPEISAEVLSKLLEGGANVVAVITNEDKVTGRKRALVPTPVKAVALAHNIPVFQPHRIKKEFDFLYSIDADLIITMAYGQLVPQEVLDYPKLGCLNLHGSLLPKYRGAAPMQRAIMDGESITGVTLMEMVLEMDAGRMYGKEEVLIGEEDNYTSISAKVASAAAKLALEKLPYYINGDLPGDPQDPEKVSFAAKILPEDEHIPLNLGVRQTLRYINALSETPGGYFFLDGLALKVYKAKFFSDETNAEVGTILEAGKRFLLQLSDGVIELCDVQLSGKKRMDARSFCNGAHLEVGSKLS